MKDILKALVFAGLFAVPFLTLYVEDNYFFPFITGKNFWFRIIVDFTVVSWGLLALLDARYRPRWSWIFGSFGILLVVMFFANLFGQHPESSFFSNFERMDGYISLVHAFLYALVLGSVMKTKKEWQYLLFTSLFVAFLVAAYGLAQYFGFAQGNGRIDSRLGNAAYMAVYMLFHIFFAFWLFVETKQPWVKTTMLFLAVMFTFVLIETGTRGTAVGLAVGVSTMAAYIALFGKQYKEIRKYAIGIFIILAVALAGFIVGRDSELVQNNPNLARIANISLEDLTVRSTIWGLAWEGVKDRPVLGWGQGNFNYVFNEYYEPSLYDQEQWFDRSHNIVFDWLIAGGILGFLAYASIFVACLWYLFIRPLLHPEDDSFTVLERGVLLGILAGYLTHNLVVFDNIVSYIFFAVVLGLIHSRVSTPIKAIGDKPVSEDVVKQVGIPVGIVVFGLIVYFVHAPGMAAASDIIDAFRASDPEVRLESFVKAVERDTFAHQEITEQLTQQTISILRQPELDPAVKEMYAVFTEEQLTKLANDKPGDARVHVFIASYYRATNQLDIAREQLELARDASPQKQAIILQQALIELAAGNYQEGVAFARTAFEAVPENGEAREYLIASLMYTGEVDEARQLFEDADQETRTRIALSDFVASAASNNQRFDFLTELFEIRTELQSDNAQSWATLAYLYYESDKPAEAIAVLNEASELLPDFASTAACFIDNIEDGNEPQIGC